VANTLKYETSPATQNFRVAGFLSPSTGCWAVPTSIQKEELTCSPHIFSTGWDAFAIRHPLAFLA